MIGGREREGKGEGEGGTRGWWRCARHELHVELEAVASDVVDLGGSQDR